MQQAPGSRSRVTLPVHIAIIGHVGYINILTWLREFRSKLEIFLSFLCPSIRTIDLDTKKTPPNIEVSPESLETMLEYWYIQRGLLCAFPNYRYTLIREMFVYCHLGTFRKTSSQHYQMACLELCRN